VGNPCWKCGNDTHLKTADLCAECGRTKTYTGSDWRPIEFATGHRLIRADAAALMVPPPTFKRTRDPQKRREARERARARAQARRNGEA